MAVLEDMLTKGEHLDASAPQASVSDDSAMQDNAQGSKSATVRHPTCNVLDAPAAVRSRSPAPVVKGLRGLPYTVTSSSH